MTKPFVSVRSRTAAALSLLLLVGGAAAARADVVAITDHGKRTRLEGAQAEEIGKLAVAMLDASTEYSMGATTDTVRLLREKSAVVEVKFEPPRELVVNGKKKATPADYLMVVLDEEPDKLGMMKVLVGMHMKPVNTLGLEFVSQPDEYGITYYATVTTPDRAEQVRAAVKKQGVELK